MQMSSNEITLITLFLLGFFGGTHCVGMCGGLSSAFALQLPLQINRITLILLMNIGRIGSYVAIGILMGALSQIGFFLDQTRSIQMILFIFSNLLLLLMGLYLAGIFSGVAKIEIIGKGIWKKINPILNQYLPIKSTFSCLIVGALWGWLPCGLVYNASLYALGSGSAVQGGLYLLAFGLGTLPNLLAMGVFATQLKSFLQNKKIRLLSGLLVSAWAIWQLGTLTGIVTHSL